MRECVCVFACAHVRTSTRLLCVCVSTAFTSVLVCLNAAFVHQSRRVCVGACVSVSVCVIACEAVRPSPANIWKVDGWLEAQ